MIHLSPAKASWIYAPPFFNLKYSRRCGGDFEVRVIVEYNGRKVWLVSTLFRDDQTGEISLLSRDTSQRFSLGNSLLIDDSNSTDTAKDASSNEEAEEQADEGDGEDKQDGQ